MSEERDDPFETALILDAIPEIAPAGRVRLATFEGGHMFYSRDASRRALHDDAEALFRYAEDRTETAAENWLGTDAIVAVAARHAINAPTVDIDGQARPGHHASPTHSSIAAAIASCGVLPPHSTNWKAG